MGPRGRGRWSWALVAFVGSMVGCQQCDDRLDVTITGMGEVSYGDQSCKSTSASTSSCPPLALKADSRVTIEARPASGWRLGQMVVNGTPVTGPGYELASPSGSVEVVVVFVLEGPGDGGPGDGGRDGLRRDALRRDGAARDGAARDGLRDRGATDGASEQGLSPCAAGKVEHLDFDLPVASWGTSKTSTSPTGSTFSVQQKASGGLAGSYLSFDLDNGGSGTICVLALRDGATYDPQARGAATAIQFSIAAATPGSAASSLQTAFSVAAVQGGKLYWVGSERLFVAYKDGWVTKDTWTHATLRPFPNQAPGAGPDLAGGPIQFGVLVCATGKRVDSGVDSWQVRICAP